MKINKINKDFQIPVHASCAGIYVHIPFCVKKCSYCDFVSGPAKYDIKNAYVEKLKEEIKNKSIKIRQNRQKIKTIYFGGGTPSILSADKLNDILKNIFNCNDVCKGAEVTIEVNPGTASYEKFKELKKSGFNRISIGIQSFNNEELKILGRIHDRDMAIKTYYDARKAGFSNISIDLMSGLPGQTEEQFKENLEMAVKLNPEHISAYSLIIEEGTEFYKRYGDNWSEEHEETDRRIYEETNDILKDAGYERYEISNYAKKGFYSRHNSSYWTGIPYYGFGLSASSLIYDKGIWKRNQVTSDMNLYLKDCMAVENEEIITENMQIEEFMFLGLRLTKGISISEFEKRFNKNFMQLYGNVLDGLMEYDLIEISGDRVFLTIKGLDLSNYCFEQFLL